MSCCHLLNLIICAIIYSGDHKQLPPTITCSNPEVQRGLGRTLFERLMLASERADREGFRMLEVQYRMHQNISDWASKSMYNGKLISHESVRNRKLSTLPLVAEKLKAQRACGLEEVTLMLIDTTGCDMHDNKNDAGSRYNEGEANIVASHVHSLLSTGLREEDIAVITPYNGQVELLRRMLLPITPKLEIRSVDGFQGGEREAVVLSLVRSSDRGGQDGIGFLRDERRLNVAVTRAKRHCAVICDCETVSKDAFIKGLLDWMEKKGEYRSGAEFTSVLNESGGNLQAAIEMKQPATKEQRLKSQKSSKDLVTRISNDSKLKEASPNSEDSKGDEKSKSPSSEGDNATSLLMVKECEAECNSGTDSSHLVTESSEKKELQLHENYDDDYSGRLNGKQNNVVPNKLLQELVLERQNRQSVQLPLKTSILQQKKKKVQAKGHILGEAKQPSIAELDKLDDMAFLDAQIEKIQTSHGRVIEAKGKGYRTIVSPHYQSPN